MLKSCFFRLQKTSRDEQQASREDHNNRIAWCVVNDVTLKRIFSKLKEVIKKLRRELKVIEEICASRKAN